MAITNQKEYEITFEWLIKFSESLEDLDKMPASNPALQQVLRDSYKNIIADLEGQIQAYADECTERRILAGLPEQPFPV